MKFSKLILSLDKIYLLAIGIFLILLIIFQVNTALSENSRWDILAASIGGEYHDNIDEIMAANSVDNLFGYLTIESLTGGNNKAIIKVNSKEFSTLENGLVRMKVYDGDRISLEKLDDSKVKVVLSDMSDIIDETLIVHDVEIYAGSIELGVIKFK